MDCLPGEAGGPGDDADADAVMLVEQHTYDVELCAAVARLPAFVIDLDLLLRIGNAGLPRCLPLPAPSRP
jgi:hypothetical protein